MQVPLEVTFRNVEKKEGIKLLVQEEVFKLETICDHITSCRVALEQPQAHQKSGNPYRVRIDIKVPRGHEIVIRREAGEGNMHDPLSVVVRDAFHAARIKLQKIVDKHHQKVKVHPAHEDTVGEVVKLFKKDGYGFIGYNGDEIYFHKNSVLNDKFDEIEVGAEVRFVEEDGENGPQASTVQILTGPRGNEAV